MTNSLVNLPRELLLKVIDHVKDSSSLFSLLQCCHLTYALTLPELYRNVEIWQPRHVNPALHFHALYTFTCNILRSHKHALLVQSFTFREVYAYASSELGSDTTGKVSHKAVDESLAKAVCRARTSKIDEKGWLRDLHSNNPNDALLAILLPSLPRLRYLNMAFPFSQRYYTRMLMNIAVRRGRAFPETAFERLQHVVIPFSGQTGDQRATGIWSNQLAYLLRVPSLQSVSARVCAADDVYLQFEDDTQDTVYPSWNEEKLLLSNVSSLALDGFGLHCSTVELAVTMCSNLKSLNLHWLCACDNDPEIANRHISAIPEVIKHASQTLESLSLTYTSWDAAADELADSLIDRCCRISLTGYPNLRTVTLSMVWIFGLQLFHWSSRADINTVPCELLTQLLPPAIEALQVERVEAEKIAPVLPNIEAVLLEKQAGRFENLHSIVLLDKSPGITCRGKLQGKYGSKDLLLEVSKFAASIGVNFKRIVLDNEPDDDRKEVLEALKQAEPWESYLTNNGWFE